MQVKELRRIMQIRFCLIIFILLFFHKSQLVFAGNLTDLVEKNKKDFSKQIDEYNKKMRSRNSKSQGAANVDKALDLSANEMKNWCLATSGKYKEFCYNINNKNAKNACLGMTKYPSFCYSVTENSLKNICLARIKKEYRGFCYNIKNKDLQNSCLGITKSKDFCYSVANQRWKWFCLGVSEIPDNCYSIH